MNVLQEAEDMPKKVLMKNHNLTLKEKTLSEQDFVKNLHGENIKIFYNNHVNIFH